MLVQKLGHYPTRFHLNGEISPLYGSGTFASRLERMHARGTHPSTYTNLSPRSHTYASDTCKFSSDSVVLEVFLRRNPLLCFPTRRSSHLDVPLTGVARCSSLLFCVCLGHRVM